MAQSQQTVLLVDSSKFGQQSLTRLCGMDKVDVVVSDAGLSREMQDQVRAAGCRLILPGRVRAASRRRCVSAAGGAALPAFGELFLDLFAAVSTGPGWAGGLIGVAGSGAPLLVFVGHRLGPRETSASFTHTEGIAFSVSGKSPQTSSSGSPCTTASISCSSRSPLRK